MYLLIFALVSVFVASSSLLLFEKPEKLTSIQIPEDPDLEIALGYSEEALMNFTELAARYGYPASEHTVITDDGYILTMFRLQGKSGRTKPTPVLMMHGLVDSSDTWIVNGPGVGLAFILADQGYDVWCGNNRGNRYARKHVTLNPDRDAKFWEYTFHQYGIYDVPAMVDYILQQTGTEQVAYVGHSQGTSDFFVLASTRPEYNKKIKVAACLAPVAWLYHLYSPLMRAISRNADKNNLILKTAGVEELFGSTEIAANILELLCQYVPKKVCGTLLFMISGYNPKHTPRETLKVIIGHFPAGTSTDNLICFGRWVFRNSFSRCDFGIKRNLEIYGTPDAAEYNLTAVTAPVALFYGGNDWLVSLRDVDTLRRALPNVVQSTRMEPLDWSHFDFVWSTLIPQFLGTKLIALFQQFNV